MRNFFPILCFYGLKEIFHEEIRHHGTRADVPDRYHRHRQLRAGRPQEGKEKEGQAEEGRRRQEEVNVTGSGLPNPPTVFQGTPAFPPPSTPPQSFPPQPS